MPLPPPPAVALSRIGNPISSAAARAAETFVAPSVPGTVGTSAARMACFAEILSPIDAITSAGGPTNTRSLSTHASTNAGFSARKP